MFWIGLFVGLAIGVAAGAWWASRNRYDDSPSMNVEFTATGRDA